MKRFEFRLETVRRWRETQMQLEQAKLRELAAALNGIRQEKSDLDQRLVAAQQAVLAPARAKGAMDARQLAELDEFRYYTRRRCDLLGRREAEIEWRIEQQRLRLVEARRSCRLLDQLRSRLKHVWEAEYAKEIEGAASDLYLAQWGKTKQSAARRPETAER